jgi:SAM-dependent methyltransferase
LKRHPRWQSATSWNGVAAGDDASWYLDPVVARQKREVHLRLIREWMPQGAQVALKTDLFEEAFGKDELLPDLSRLVRTWIAIDVSPRVVRRAAAGNTPPRAFYLAADARSLPLRARCLDMVVSTSTLDHFATRAEFEQAIVELVRVLRPGGHLIVTVDNPSNPLYPLLRWLCRWGPFPLGYTPPAAELNQILERTGFEVTATQALIHNPRFLSSGIFLALRRTLRAHADRPIEWLLAMFAVMDRLPTRRFTACFLAARAVRRSVPGNGSCRL